MNDSTVTVGSTNISEEIPDNTPVIRLIKIKAGNPANALPARSFAKNPPTATANKTCKLPMIAHPIPSITRAIVAIRAKSPPDIAINLAIEIIIPAAGITAMITINAFTTFYQQSNDNKLFSQNDSLLILSVLIKHRYVLRMVLVLLIELIDVAQQFDSLIIAFHY